MRSRGPIHLACIAGIDLYLHWTWFLVLFYEVGTRAGAYSSLGWNVVEVLALFLIVTLHEFGHALACRQVGGVANRILLWPFGGIAYVDTPPRPGATLWTIAAGPLVNVALVPVLGLLQRWGASSVWMFGHPDALTFLRSLVYINLGLLIFNIFPVYPLDGGQILRALLWYPLGRARSLMAAVIVGFAGVAVLLYVAARTQDLWLGLITVFILQYCWSGMKQARALWRRSKLPRHAGFACPWCQSPPPVAELWTCGQCQHPFDPFASGGPCPLCATQGTQVQCLDCGHAFPQPGWTGAAVAPALR